MKKMKNHYQIVLLYKTFVFLQSLNTASCHHCLSWIIKHNYLWLIVVADFFKRKTRNIKGNNVFLALTQLCNWSYIAVMTSDLILAFLFFIGVINEFKRKGRKAHIFKSKLICLAIFSSSFVCKIKCVFLFIFLCKFSFCRLMLC